MTTATYQKIYRLNPEMPCTWAIHDDRIGDGSHSHCRNIREDRSAAIYDQQIRAVAIERGYGPDKSKYEGCQEAMSYADTQTERQLDNGLCWEVGEQNASQLMDEMMRLTIQWKYNSAALAHTENYAEWTDVMRTVVDIHQKIADTREALYHLTVCNRPHWGHTYTSK
jgi:hypothetical protein